MPIYEYRCPECGAKHEAIKKVNERQHNACPLCGVMAEQMVTACHFDPKMGVDPSFPTAYAKWGKKHKALGEGRMRDSNQTAYGTSVDVERTQYDARKRATS